MKVITKFAVNTAEGWRTSFENIQSQEALDYATSLPRKGEIAVSFFVEKETDMPSGWAVATVDFVDKRGEVHKVNEITKNGLLRVFKPSYKAPASVESLKALYGQK